MKRIALLASSIFLVLSTCWQTQAQNLTISGGNSNSVMICAKGLVYAWGANRTTTGGAGVLGLGPTHDATDKILTPTLVALPTATYQNLAMQQVDAGSGAHTLGATCNGIAFAWGENDKLQVGSGSSAAAVKIPSPVLKGATPGYPLLKADGTLTGNLYLGDVAYVSGSTNSSYAVLNDGQLVAWGNNADKQLGNPSVTGGTSGAPVYVQTQRQLEADGTFTNLSSPQNLTGVASLFGVDAGDACAFALVDPDGDGLGTVYSWGANTAAGYLGRGLGITNNGIAMPVLKQDGTPLNDIIKMSAGDVHCLAIDINGNVWAWGDDGWGGLTGTLNGAALPYAKKVVSGEYKTISGEDLLTNAIDIAAGQGFSMAVTADGYALAWGNNTNAASGGATGNCGTENSYKSPVFIKSGTGNLTNVASISDGDTWGYAITYDNKFYSWGYNGNGNLGIGTTANSCSAVEMTAQIPCSIPDPCPIANMPSTLTICEGTSLTLSSGFNVSGTLRNNYRVRWRYYDENGVRQSQTETVGALTTTVNKAGSYAVRIDYFGNNVPCKDCDLTYDSVVVSYYKADFQDPVDDGVVATDTNFYCGANTNPYVVGPTTGKYEWYATKTSTTVLGTSTASNPTSTTIAVPGTGANALILNKPKVYEIWVEDKSSFDKTLGEPTNTTLYTAGDANNVKDGDSYLKFSIKQDVTLNSFKVLQRVYGPATYNIELRKDDGTLVKTLTGASGTGTGGAWVVTTVSANVDLPIGNYTLTAKEVSGSVGIRNFVNVSADPATKYFKDYSGILEFLSNDKSKFSAFYQPNTIAGYFDWSVSAGSTYPCGRVKVLLYEKCKCANPSAVRITTTGTALEKCVGGTTTLKGEFDMSATNPITKQNMYYVWYKEGSPVATANYVAITPKPVKGATNVAVPDKGFTSPVLAAADSGNWVLRVQDGRSTSADSAVCYTENKVLLKVVKLPTNPTATIAAICSGGSATLNKTSPPAPKGSYFWYEGTSGGAPIPNNTPTVALAATKNYYLVDSMTTGAKCTSGRVLVPVTVNPLPTITGTLKVCVGLTTQLASTSTKATSNAWVSSDITIATVDNSGLVKGEKSGSVDITFTDDKGCKDVKTVVVNGLPATPTFTPAAPSYCAGSNLSVEAKSTTSGVTYAWTAFAGSTVTGLSTATISKTSVGLTEKGKYTVVVTDANTCTSTADVTVDVIALPGTPTAPSIPAICAGKTVTLDKASPAASATYFWYGPTGGAALANGTVISTLSASTTYYLIDSSTTSGCKSARTPVAITVNNAPSDPSITVSPNQTSFCAGVAHTLTAASATPASGVTYKWSNGSTANTAMIDGVITEGSYTYEVIATANGCSSNKVSKPITVTPVTKITTQPAGATICEGTPFSSTIVVTGTGTPTFQWQKANASNTLVDTVGATNATLSISNIVPSNAGTYAVKVTGTCGSPLSTNVILVVKAKPRITKQPAAKASDCAGGRVSLDVAASGYDPKTYEWRQGSNVKPGQDKLFLTGLVAADAGFYTVKVSNECGDITSTQSEVTVSSTSIPEVSLVTTTALYQCGGLPASKVSLKALPVTGGGNAPRFVFSVSTDGGLNYVPVPTQPDSLKDNVEYPLPANNTNAVVRLVFKATMRSTSGCIASGAKSVVEDTLAIKIDPAVDQTMADIKETKATVCQGTRTLTLTNSLKTGYNGTWNSTNGVDRLPGVDKVDLSNIQTNSQTLTTFTVTSPMGLCPSAFDTVTTMRPAAITNPNIVASDNNAIICSDTSSFPLLKGLTTLEGWETGTWSVPVGATNTVNTSTGQTANLQLGLNRFIYTVKSSVAVAPCDVDTALVTINVEKEPDAAIAGSAANTCAMTYTLGATAVTNGSGVWTGGIVTPANQKDGVASLTKNVATTFTWTVSNGPSSVCKAKRADVVITQAGDITPASPVSVQSKSICISDAAPVLNTNALSPLKPVVESGSWFAVAPATIDPATGQTGALAVGDNVFKYEIKTTVPGCKPDTGKVTIKVIAQPVASISLPNTLSATVALPINKSYTFNSTSLAIKADKPDLGYKGEWKVVKFVGAVDPELNLATTSLDNQVDKMALEDVSILTWTVSEETNTCKTPAIVTDTLKRKNITEALAFSDTICFSSGSYTSKKPKNIPNVIVGESGIWTALNSAPVPTTTANYEFSVASFPAKGKYEYEYKISNTLSGGVYIESKNTYTIYVDDKPTVASISGTDPTCEGGIGSYGITNLSSVLALPQTYKWEVNSFSTSGGTRTFVGADNAVAAQIKFESTNAYKEDKDSATVYFEVSNSKCGSTKVSRPVVFKLAPRKFNLGDTINGPKEFCASVDFVTFKLDREQPNASPNGYIWTIGTNTKPAGVVSSSFDNTNWPTNQSSNPTVTVELTNECSAGRPSSISAVILPKSVNIVQPAPVAVTIERDVNNLDSIFCVPQTQLVFKAITNTNLSNLIADYEFSVNGSVTKVASTDTSYSPLIGDIQDSAVVSVRIIPASNQCIDYNSPSTTDDFVVQGFNYPDSTIITPAILKICGDGDRIELSVNRTKNRKNFYNDKSISWFRDGKLVAIDSSNTKSYKLVLSQPSETGVYSVKLNRNVCADSSESIVANNPNVVIYEKPVLGFAVDPLIIIYREGIVVPLPAYVTPPKMKDSKFVYSYRNGDTTWLRNPDSLRALIVPTREQKEWYYNLVVTNGDTSIPTSVCRTAGDIRVINSLPLMIPNAFSPNGDGLNDTWVINGLIKFTDVKVSVFNRWGNRVFYDTNGYKTPWDGNVNGVPLATGTYYAIIELSGSTDNSDENITRSLTIVR